MYHFFFKHFLRNPKSVGAIVPLSQSVSNKLVKDLTNRTDSRPWRILEAGAGVGNISKKIIEKLRPGDHLDIIEIDQECCDLLEKKFGHDKRVTIHCMSVLDWVPSYRYDFIVSTLPINSFNPELVKQLLEHYQKITTDEALCNYVEYIGLEDLNLVFAKKEKRRSITSRRKLLRDFHKTHLVKKDKVLTNFLPCYVYHMAMHNPIKREQHAC